MTSTRPARHRETRTRRTIGSVLAVVPAHDEADTIAAAITSLRSQTRPPDRILVVCDNCTDDTEAIARAFGVEVVRTVGNRFRKAGALNQVLADVIAATPTRPGSAEEDAVLVMDADSVLDRDFVRAACETLADPTLGGVGGTFRGGPGGGLVGVFQRNEYARYQRDVKRLQGRALVLTGTASLFPVAVLAEVVRARTDGRLPDHGGAAAVYDVHVLTEDNELSFALQHLGHRILAPAVCTLETEVMTTWRALARQRLRWKRGALENLLDYGWTPVTRRYWARQLLSFLGVVATATYLATLVWGIHAGVHLRPFWIALTGLFALERVVTVRSRGPAQMVLGATVVIEMVYDVFLQAVQARAFVGALAGTRKEW